MTAVRLKAIWHGCDFRLSDARLYEDFRSSASFPGDLKPGEVYLFVAASQRQLIWFLNQQADRHNQVTFTDSRRWRFTGKEKWEPAMLSQYAKLAGLQLKGIELFNDSYHGYREFLQERQIGYRERAKARKAARKGRKY